MIAILVGCWLMTIGVSSEGQTPSPLAAMSKVYVEPMGQDHEAFRFRKLLADGLSKRGFTVVNDASEADVVLATTLSTPVVAGDSRAYASVEVKTRDGKKLWGGEFPSGKRWPSGRDYVKKLAEEVAAAFEKARRQSTTPHS